MRSYSFADESQGQEAWHTVPEARLPEVIWRQALSTEPSESVSKLQDMAQTPSDRLQETRASGYVERIVGRGWQ